MTPNEEEILKLLKAWAPEVSRLLNQAGYFTLPEGTEKAKIAQTIGLDPGGRLHQKVKAASLEKNGKIWPIVLDEYSLKEFKAGARQVAKDLGLSFPKWDWNEAAQEHFQKHGLQFVKNMSQTDLDNLRGHIQTDFGLNPKAFTKRYADAYPCSEARLERIKRTETHTHSEAGGFKFAKDADAETKTWNCSPKGKWPRPSHRAIWNETVPLDEEFSNGQQWPSDVNCRCYLTYNIT